MPSRTAREISLALLKKYRPDRTDSGAVPTSDPADEGRAVANSIAKELKSRFGASRVMLFGSFARGWRTPSGGGRLHRNARPTSVGIGGRLRQNTQPDVGPVFASGGTAGEVAISRPRGGHQDLINDTYLLYRQRIIRGTA